MTGVTVKGAPAAARGDDAPSVAGDFWGGLAAMMVAVPSSIAYGVAVFSAITPALAPAGALAGIAGAAILGVIAPAIGRNGGFITAPCAPAAAVLGGLATALMAARTISPEQVVSVLLLTSLVAGALQIVFGAIGAGRLIKFIPYQVVTGYMSGVALIIAMTQLPKLLGVAGKTHLAEAIVSPAGWDAASIIVGGVTIISMIAAQELKVRLPGAIVGLAAGIGAYMIIAAAFRPELASLRGNHLVIGPIGGAGSIAIAAAERVRSLFAIRLADLTGALAPALTLSILLSMDTLKTGVILDALTRRRHRSNRELIGQGVANVASSLVGGMPGAGTMGPTLVNVTSGGRSVRSGMVEGVLVVLTLLVLGRFIAWVPLASLAGILLVIAARMFDVALFRLLLKRSTRVDFIVIAAVIITAISAGLMEAAVVGVVLAILLFIRDQIRTSVVLRKHDLSSLRSKRLRSREASSILDQQGEEGAVVQLQGDLFFGTTDQLFTILEEDLRTRRFILLDLRRVHSMDYTAAHLFRQMRERLVERGGELLFSGMPSRDRSDIEHYLSELGLMGSQGGLTVFETRDAALEWMEEKILESEGWQAPESAPPLPLGEMACLRGLDVRELETVAQSVREISLPAGEKLFSRGDHGDEMFFVRKGRVQILLPLEGGKRHHLATFCRGEFFGEVSFLDRGDRSADAEAATPTELYGLSRSEFDRVASANPELAARIFEQLARGIAQRLRTTDVELRALEER
jgi:SulP family sulfate permease